MWVSGGSWWANCFVATAMTSRVLERASSGDLNWSTVADSVFVASTKANELVDFDNPKWCSAADTAS